MNGTLQIELKQIQNRNQFFDQMLVESKKYLNDLTDFQAEYLCLYPNKLLNLDLIEDGFSWVTKKSFEYNKLFPIYNIDQKLIYTTFIGIRNKWIKYSLAEWSENNLRFSIPNKTVQFISIYNTEEELIKNIYQKHCSFNCSYESNKYKSKEIMDWDLYHEWYILHTNSLVYSYLITNYDINR